jgi:hypothetical protein
MSGFRPILPFALCLLPFAFLSCGYHVAATGTSNALPLTVKTIAIPAFNNVTVRYKLTSILPEAITREFISRTRYRVVNDPKDADAVLTGAVLRVDSVPLTVDPKTGRAASIQGIVTMRLTLRDRATNAVLFENLNFQARQTYEIAVDPKAYFDESDVAMDRLSREVARSVVSAILENF